MYHYCDSIVSLYCSAKHSSRQRQKKSLKPRRHPLNNEFVTQLRFVCFEYTFKIKIYEALLLYTVVKIYTLILVNSITSVKSDGNRTGWISTLILLSPLQACLHTFSELAAIRWPCKDFLWKQDEQFSSSCVYNLCKNNSNNVHVSVYDEKNFFFISHS